jgi:hypothetical protein
MFELISEGKKGVRVADQRLAEEQLKKYLELLGAVSSRIRLATGEAFGLRISVDGWLCGPIRDFSLWRPGGPLPEPELRR